MLLLLLGSLDGSDLQSQAPPTFHSDTEVVRLDVVVLDGRGQPVTGLTASDFVVEESGKPRSITSFEPIVVQVPTAQESSDSLVPPPPYGVPRVLNPEEGRCVLIFFDDVHLTSPTDGWLAPRVQAFLARELRDGDWLTLVAPHSGIWWTARTTWEYRQVPAVIARVRGQLVRDPFRKGMSEVDAMHAVERAPRTLGEPRGREELGMIGGRNLLAEEIYQTSCRRIAKPLWSLKRAVFALAGLRGRKSLVLYSEGFIFPQGFAGFDEVIELARRANVAIHFVDPAGLMGGCPPTAESTGFGGCSEAQRRMARAGTIHLAEETGGRESSINDPTDELERVMNESSAYYLIGFSPASDRPGLRRVRVRVRGEGLTILAPTRYVLTRPGALKTDVSLEVAALNSVADATGVPLSLEVSYPEQQSDGSAISPRGVSRSQRGTARLVVAALEIRPEMTTAPRHLKAVAQVRPRDGGEALVDAFEVTIPATANPARIERRWSLSPGIWQCRIAVRDSASGRLGSVLLTFEVTPARDETKG